MRVGLLAVALAFGLLVLFLGTRLPDGASRRMIVASGAARSYVLYLPDKRSPRPALVLVLHGRGGDGASFERRTRQAFDRRADRDGAIVVYPDALQGQWNAGHRWEQRKSDDIGFLTMLIEKLSAEFHVDRTRVYVAGYSNGASMAYRLACEQPGQIAAIAPVSGGLAREIMQLCPAGKTRPIPLLVIHGTADPINRFDDGELEGNLRQWVARNGCRSPPDRRALPDIDPADGTLTRVESYPGCRAGADVMLYAVEGGGHHWPGGDEPWLLDNGPDIRDFDAGATIWEFFRRHPMP